MIRLLAGAAVLTLVLGVAFGGGAPEDETNESPAPPEVEQRNGAVPGLTTGEGEIRTAEETLTLGHGLEEFMDNMMSGGPPPDGIPSIDDPHFVSADEAGLDPGDKIIGLAYDGVVRAYPQHILVYHEIVNHKIGNENIAITYCPLTATAQGFKSGSTTLGVSGRLVNSNLVMYDRDTGSLWPQIAATAVAGRREGETLEEINLYWTTWAQWSERYPETEVLSTDTGHVRDYNRDPYGSYNPLGGYYQSDRTVFPVMHRDDRYHPKHMVLGARTAERSVFFDLEELSEQGIQKTESFISVYDRSLDTGYIYLTEDGEAFEYADGKAMDSRTGEQFAPGELPLEPVVAVEAFSFAWKAFYPESEHP